MNVGELRKAIEGVPDDYEVIPDVWGFFVRAEVSHADSRLNRSGFVVLVQEDDSELTLTDDPNAQIYPEIGDELD